MASQLVSLAKRLLKIIKGAFEDLQKFFPIKSLTMPKIEKTLLAFQHQSLQNIKRIEGGSFEDIK